jgi:MarR family transcriptional regulator, organic hydroperoxide resistance regulator
MILVAFGFAGRFTSGGLTLYTEPMLEKADRQGESDSPVFRVWVNLRQTNDLMVKARDQDLRRHGISHEYAAIIFLVHFLGHGATPAEIARQRYRRPHTISHVLESMRRAGLVELCRDLERRNLVRVALTPAGEAAFKHSQQSGSVARMLGGFTADEIAALGDILLKLHLGAAAALDIRAQTMVFPGETAAYRLWRLFRRSVDVMTRVRERELANHNISIEFASVLAIINRLGDRATPAEIARQRYRLPNTISHVLIGMERAGLVRRQPSPRQRNRVMVSLTPQGAQVNREVHRAESVARMFNSLSAAELVCLDGFLERLRAAAAAELNPAAV